MNFSSPGICAIVVIQFASMFVNIYINNIDTLNYIVFILA